MFKTSRIATAVLTAAGATLAAVSPAVASPGIAEGEPNPAATWDFSAAPVCFQELAVLPAGGGWAGDVANHCVNGNVLGHGQG